MRWQSLIVPLVNLVVFVGAGAALWELGRRPLADKATPEAEDIVLNMPADVAVRVGSIEKVTLQRKLTAYGQIEPAPAGHDQAGALARISAPRNLPVASLQCIEGQRVNKGDVLFMLDSSAVDARMLGDQQLIDDLQASAVNGDAWAGIQTVAIGLAKCDLARAKAEREMLAVRSPSGGVVSAIHINVGEMAGPTTVAVEVIDPERLVAALDVPAAQAALIKIGAAVELAGREARVAYVDPVANAGSGMVSVDVPLPPHAGYVPGQTVSAQIVVEQVTDCLAVPAESIVYDETGWTSIALVNPDQHGARLHAVTVGMRDGDKVQVQGQDLEAGQTIVTTGAAALVNRTGIHLIEETLPPMGH